MFAYVDETGNTGANLFDKAQPEFITAALLTRTDFDIIYGRKIKNICEKLGVDILHANRLGLGKLEEIADELLKILKSADARFFISRVDKKYLAVTKIVDTIFDSGENLAVPWHSYNFRPLRMLLVFKVAHLLDEPLIRTFWAALMERKEVVAYELFVNACKELVTRVNALPDARSREIVTGSLKWAIDNPEAIYIHSNSQILRNGHMPNMVAFVNLLDGIEQKSNAWGVPVDKITHDRQMEFQKSLQYWHEIFSNASPDPVFLPLGEKHVFRRVFGSKFIISNSGESAGLQVADIVLWLFKRVSEGKGLGATTAPLLLHIFRRANQHDFSFESVSEYLEQFMVLLNNSPLTEEQMTKGRELLNKVESRRQEQMLQHTEKKLLAGI